MRTRKKTYDFLLTVISLYLFSITESDAAVRSVYKIQPNKAGANGGTKITIDGTGFSANNYESGNKVVFVSKSLTRTYECAVSKDGTTEVQILCTTVSMDPGYYYVRVYVDNEPISDNSLCGGNPFRSSCQLKIDSKSTPQITEVIPRSQSALPGTVIELCGLIMSAVYGSHISINEITNGVTAQILRVYAGYQLCELKKDDDELYGIVMNNGGLSLSGCLKCRMKGTFIGNSNASIIIDGSYGRSIPDMNILRVSAKDQLYMIQTYAEITGVSPVFGSTVGGLRLTIMGKYFDTNTKVMIGGTMCEIEGEITPESLICVTSSQSTSPTYTGNRGLMLEIWNATSSSFANLDTTFSSLTGNEADYYTKHIDQFYFKEAIENSVFRIKGFFVPPHTGEYAFLLRGNKGAKLYVTINTASSMNPDYKSQVVHITSHSLTYKESIRYTLQGGTPYYIEAIHQVDAGEAELQVAAKFFNTEILSSMTGFSKAERQKLDFRSDVIREEQIIEVTGFNLVTHTNEVQQVTVMESGQNSDAKFQLMMFGVATEQMTTQESATEITKKLNDLSFLDSHEMFTIVREEINTPTKGLRITITFNSERGEFPSFESKRIPGSSGEMLTVTVSRTTAGVPSGQYFALSHTGITIPSGLIKINATAKQVQDALSTMYSARCLKSLEKPAGKFKFYNYETSMPPSVYGILTNEIEPFCGLKVAKNPNFLFRDVTDGKGILLSTSVYMLCFAYRGGELQNRIYIVYYYSRDDKYIYSAVYVPVSFSDENIWHYFCLDMMTTLRDIRPTATQFYVKYIRVFKLGEAAAFYIDNVLIGREEPVDNIEGINDYRLTPVKPNDALIQEVIVESTQTNVYTVKLIPHKCGYNFTPLTAVAPLVSGGQVLVNEINRASRPLTGTFDVSFDGHKISGLPHTIEGDALAEEVETIPGIGSLYIKRYGDCANFYFIITFLSRPGDVQQILIDGSNIDGVGVIVTGTTLQDGGLLYDPLPGDMLRTFHTEPQVTVVVNDIPSLCSGNCMYDWSAAQTPTLTSCSPILGALCTGSPGVTLTLQGTGFDGTTPENNIVLTGTLPCTVVTATETTITCTTGEGPKGITMVTVRVVGKGLASGSKPFIFKHAVNSFSPTTVSLGGGIPVEILGEGFADNTKVFINDDVPCEVTHVIPSHITCILPAMAPGSYRIYVKIDLTSIDTTPITYDASISPSISSVTPTVTGVAGGDTITITGSGFGTSGTLRIGDTEVVAVFTDTKITATLPSLPPGDQKVWVFSGSTGAAVNSLNQIPVITYQLKVSNVFPLSGSMFGGTRVTFTGQGFSTNFTETEIMIGEHNCDIQSATLTQIVCQIEYTGDVVDITNYGTNKELFGHFQKKLLPVEEIVIKLHSMPNPELFNQLDNEYLEYPLPAPRDVKLSDIVFGKGFDWYPKNTQLKVGDIARWKWSIPYPFMVFTPRVMQVENPNTLDQPEDGFISAAARSGLFEYKVSVEGIYYYSSGWIDQYQLIKFHGTLHVAPREQFVGEISLKVAGHDAMYDINSGVVDPSPPAVCGEVTSDLSGCTSDSPTVNTTDRFIFLFSNCSTPSVCTFSINQGTTEDILMINGEGFSTTECQNIVMIGQDICHVESSSESHINCSLNAADEPIVGKPQTISLTVLNRGHALIIEPGQIARTFVLLPMISSLSPLMFSLNGQGHLKITGSGFVGNSSDISVRVQMTTCDVESVTFTEITCRTPPMSAGDYIVEVKVSIDGQLISAICKDGNECKITYNTLNTPRFTDVSPLTLDGSLTVVTVTGEVFGTQSETMVKIGGVECYIFMSSDSEIKCNITNVPVGTQDIQVLRQDLGLATNANNLMVTSSALINSISPDKGSIHGGTMVQIDGNGFTSDTMVKMDGNDCQVTMVMLSMVKCTTPSHSAQNNVPVVVTANGVTYPSLTFSYTTSESPEITSISPSTTERGQTIFINGNGFSTTTSQNTVTVGSVDCPVTMATANGIQCTAPAIPLGTHKIVVHVDGKGFSNDDKTIMYSITISDISPAAGSSGGGQRVTISGSGFGDGTMVTICDEECMKVSDASQTADSNVCLTPIPSGAVAGTLVCDVKVKDNSVEDTLTNRYTYNSALTPTVSMVSPRRGGSGGGVTLTIQGIGFGTNSADAMVTIGGTPCIISSIDNTVITCVTEPHSPPEVTSVKVEVNGNGVSVEGTEGDAKFEYVDLWSSPYTWGGKSPPENGTLVVIQKGQTVVLDTDTNYLKMLLIKGGHLIFDEKDVELMADNILIVEGGSLTIGTEEQPFQHKAKITCAAHVRTKELPIYGTCSVGVRHGTLDIHGEPLDVTWTRLTATAAKGSDTITVYDAVNTGSRHWRTGDQIVIATTGGHKSQRQTEVHYIKSVANDGVTITLVDPLEYEHLGTMETIGSHTFEYRAEVGMYSRNILFQGYSDPQWNDKIKECENGFDLGEFSVQTCFQGRFGEELGTDQFGIQVIVHPPTPGVLGMPETQKAISRISNAEWFYAGQAFRLGRYPMHYHLMGDASQSYIKKCALHKTFNRAVNIHGTHNVTVEDNVIYDIMGGAFFLEDGIETLNTFKHNLALFVRASTSLLNDDIAPAAFWVTNAHNTVINNAAAGGTHFGFWYRTEGIPRGPSRTTSVNPVHDGNVIFKGNTVHSCGWFGLWVFPEFLPRDNALSSGSPIAAVFEDFYVYNCEKGAETVFAGSVQFENFRMVNNKVGLEHKQFVEGSNFLPDGPLIRNSVIVGSSTVLPVVLGNSGIVLPLTHRLLIDGVEFHGFTATNTAAFKYAHITGKSSTYSGGFEVQTKNLVFNDVGPNHRGIFDWEFHGYIIDQDGSLIGQLDKKGWSVVTFSNLLPSSCLDFPAFSHPGKTPAKICPPSVRFHRFSFNNIHPESLDFKNFLISNSNGQAFVPWARKRMTHPKGWMNYMPSRSTYDILWENAEHMTNISFTGRMDRFRDGDWVILKTKVAQKPDCVETDGICVNETDADSLDGAVHYHGDWIHVPNEMSVYYLVSYRERSQAKRRKRAVDSDSNIYLYFNLYKCLYPDCEPPADPNTLPPEDVRPNNAVYWNETSSWPNGTLPVDGDCLAIPEDTWMVANTEIPPLCELILYGTLELEANDGTGGYRSFEIKTPRIVIMGKGRLIAGFNKYQPFLGNLDIILQGSHSSQSYNLEPDDRDLGAKAISVFGGLDLNGKQLLIPWTTLDVTGIVGESSITVSRELDWAVGSDIVVTATGYNPWETETFKLTAVSTTGNTTVLSLNDTLKYRHLAFSESINGKDQVVAAEVGLLSRNIRIIGEDYPDLYPESFGGRVLITAGLSGTGYTRLSNVEFYHMGQEGYTEWYDPRYALAFVDAPVGMSRPSYIESCAFHHSFSPSIGIYNSHNVPVINNVIHYSVGWAIQTTSAGTELRGNLVTLTLWPGSYQNRVEASNYDYDGAISAIKATGLILEGNAVSAGERTCYHIPPQTCDPGATGLYSNNIARTCLLGIMVLPADQLSGDCGRFTGFSISKCPYYGIYYNNMPSLQVDNVCIFDSAIGVFPMVIGPASLSHLFADKFVLISDSLIIGKSNAFNCGTDVLDTAEDNVRLTGSSRPFELTRRIGVIFGQFTSGGNKFPEKPALNIMAYQSIKGITRIEGVTFAGFNDDCNTNGTAITTNKNNDDGQHPVEVQGLTFVGVTKDHRVFYDRPRLEVIDDSNCVDMDCDGLKKALIKDLDGSLLGEEGAVIPQSEFEWNGDPRRGLGDYRIPKSLLTTVSGIRIPPAEYKGVIRNQSCVYHERWQAYECLDLNYEMLVIESMDEDTEIRRISPVAIEGHDRQGNGYVDLINGPQDHGWCFGYTCRKRLSTFQALVITDRRYQIHFTGTTPQNMRYFLLNTEDTDCVVLGVFYTTPYRLDLYMDGTLVFPKNYEGKLINGELVYTLKPTTFINEYVPVLSDPAGSNWFDRNEGMFYFQMCGPAAVEVRTQLAVIISFKYPPATIDEFYGELIVEYIVEFFNIPYTKVRVVDIVRADSSRRRKRSTEDIKNDVITLEISDAPSYDVNGTVSDPFTWERLQEILATAVNEAQLGNYSVIVNNKVVAVSVAPPRTVKDPLYATINDGKLGGYKVVVAVDRLDFHQTILPTVEGLPFLRQPKIKVLDAFGNRISELGTPDYPWFITATLRGGNPSAGLIGNTTVQFEDGWANFTNLGINYFGSGYYLDFNISSPAQGENFSVSSEMIDIAVRQVNAVVIDTTVNAVEQTDISVTLELRGKGSGLMIEDIAWRNHTWNVEATLSNIELSEGTLSGTTQITFDPETSHATFSALQFSTYGFYVVKFRITTVPQEYDFEVKHMIRVKGQHHVYMEETAAVKLKFDGQYSLVIGNEPEYMLDAYLGDKFAHEHSDVEVLSSVASTGSIVWKFTIQGTKTNVNSTLYAICNDVINGTTDLTYNGYDLTLTPYMTQNGEKFYGAKCGPIQDDDDDGDKDYTLPIIIACSMVGLALFVIIIFCVLWKCKVIPKTKTADLTKNDWSDVDDILFREKSFMSVSSYGKNAPMATNLFHGGYYGYNGKRTPDGLEF